MPTIQNNMAMIRRLLGSPSPQEPDDALLFELLGNQVLHHQSQLQNSSAQWSVNEWQFTTGQGVEDYLVTATDFGKPFWCYTVDPGNTYQTRIEIPFCKMQNADQFYSGPVQAYADNAQNPAVSTFSFYRKADAWYVRVTPIPGTSSLFSVWYECAPTQPAALGDTPGLTSFHHLIRVQTALAALPYCSWGSVSAVATDKATAAAWERKEKTLAMALVKQEADFQYQFSTYLSSIVQPGVERRLGYGDDYMSGTDWGGGVGSFGQTWNVGP